MTTDIDLTGLTLLDWREGDAATIDVATQLTTKGEDATPGALNITGHIRKIVIAGGTDGAATGGAVVIVHLRGTGGSGQSYPVAMISGGTTAQASSLPNPPVAFSVNLEWKGQMQIWLEQVGADSGTARAAVFLYGQ